MAVTRCCSLSVAGLIVLFVALGGAVVQADPGSTLSAEQNRLARMEQALENRQVELEDLENELLSHEYRMQQAQQALDAARKNYEESKAELAQAEREHQLNKSQDSERHLNRVKHSFAMAERGVDSRGRRLEFIQSNQKDIKTQHDAAQAAVAQGQNQVTEQQRKVDQLVQAMLTKAENSQRTAAAPPTVALSRPKVPAPSVAALQVTEAPAAEVVELEREIDPELLDYVRREEARLRGVLEEGDDKQTFRNLMLDPSGGESLPFEFLGGNQYRLVAPVAAGRQTYKINTWRFRRTIPAEDAGERYVFIFDARRLARPRLVMFPEYVLSNLD